MGLVRREVTFLSTCPSSPSLSLHGCVASFACEQHCACHLLTLLPVPLPCLSPDRYLVQLLLSYSNASDEDQSTLPRCFLSSLFPGDLLSQLARRRSMFKSYSIRLETTQTLLCLQLTVVCFSGSVCINKGSNATKCPRNLRYELNRDCCWFSGR